MNKDIDISVQRYNSTYGFVTTNKLDEVAKKCFGNDWEAEDDVNQIEELLAFIGRTDLIVTLIPDLQEDDILITETKIEILYVILGKHNVKCFDNFNEDVQDIDLTKVRKYEFSTKEDKEIAIELLFSSEGYYNIIDKDNFNLLIN
tara:strand:+ start:734 stop:1171 length:438 start_codon:yes stop_codon:yes gene_type:complete